MNLEKIQKELIESYGPAVGMRIGAVVLPNITKDFQKMLDKAPVFAEVREEYHFDDMKGSITIVGQNRQIKEYILNR